MWGIGFGIYATLSPLFLKDLGATPTDIGLVFGAGNVLAAMTFLPIGLAADRWGAKPLMVGAWIASTVGAAAFLPLTDWHGAFVGSFLYWIGSAAFPLLVFSRISLIVPSRRMVKVIMTAGAVWIRGSAS